MPDFVNVAKMLPPEFPGDLTKNNHLEFLNRNLSIIVLDDDPTGTQTISDVPVLTTWAQEEILKELEESVPLFFILTNSRSLTPPKADALAFEIGKNIRSASDKAGRNVMVISRGDSTLRGHYPNEVVALGEGLGWTHAPHILIPALFQGGRHTVGDIHYVREGNQLIPAGETPFARDSVFGYRASNLKMYVEEKTGGKINQKDVVSISLDLIRKGGPDAVAKCVSDLQAGQVCIVNAFCQSDLDVFAAGYYKSGRVGYPMLFRTAASFINSMSGLPPKDPLRHDDFTLDGAGGVVLVGSYVPKTTRQLEFMKDKLKAGYIEVNTSALLSSDGMEQEISRVSDFINNTLGNGQVSVVFTSRKLIEGKNSSENMAIINRVSDGIVEIMSRIEIRPRFMVVKGGITSSDVLTRSLGVKRAGVLGQISSGVPVWRLDDCDPFPGLIFIPFPGNLGDDDTVYNVVIKLI